jgi:hypothetical protein
MKSHAASCYNQAFDLWESGENPVKALELAATSLNLYREVGTPVNVAIGFWMYSRTLLAVHAADAALAAARASIGALKDVENPADWLTASCLEGLARAQLAAGHADAANTLAQAQGAISQIADADDRELIASQIADLL